MTSRRNFLGMAAAGSAFAAGGLIAGRPGLAAPESGTQSGAGERTRHYVPPIKFGLGGVTLGNEFEVITDEDAYKTSTMFRGQLVANCGHTATREA